MSYSHNIAFCSIALPEAPDISRSAAATDMGQWANRPACTGSVRRFAVSICSPRTAASRAARPGRSGQRGLHPFEELLSTKAWKQLYAGPLRRPSPEYGVWVIAPACGCQCKALVKYGGRQLHIRRATDSIYAASRIHGHHLAGARQMAGSDGHGPWEP